MRRAVVGKKRVKSRVGVLRVERVWEKGRRVERVVMLMGRKRTETKTKMSPWLISTRWVGLLELSVFVCMYV